MTALQVDTRERILDIAQNLLETRGYNAFSYQDIADELGIKKASLHYHFATKAALGAALAQRHAERALAYLGEVDQADLDPWARLDAFFTPFLKLADTCERMCAGGVIAAEFPTLDGATQSHMKSFFDTLHRWLTALLEDGRSAGAFVFSGPAKVKADVIIAALEGMILLARVRQDARFLKPMILDLKTTLGG